MLRNQPRLCLRVRRGKDVRNELGRRRGVGMKQVGHENIVILGVAAIHLRHDLHNSAHIGGRIDHDQGVTAGIGRQDRIRPHHRLQVAGQTDGVDGRAGYDLADDLVAGLDLARIGAVLNDRRFLGDRRAEVHF